MGNLVYDHHDPVTGRYTEVETEGKGLIFVHSQDTRPIVESAEGHRLELRPVGAPRHGACGPHSAGDLAAASATWNHER